MDLSRELALARSLALTAGDAVNRWRGGELHVERKAGNEPVTAADREASSLIVEGLGAAFPDDLVVSEEAPVDVDRLASAPRAWFVDPIDGTLEFIGGDDGFAVMIGLVLEGEPVVGVVFQPATGRLYTGARGQGARTCLRGEPEEVLRVSAISRPEDARLVSSRSRRPATIDRLKALLGIRDEQALGSVGLKLGVIARGLRDIYVNPGSDCKVWDTCAPELLLQEAGGRLTDPLGTPLSYRGPDLRMRRGLLATNGALHDEVVARIAELFVNR